MVPDASAAGAWEITGCSPWRQEERGPDESGRTVGFLPD